MTVWVSVCVTVLVLVLTVVVVVGDVVAVVGDVVVGVVVVVVVGSVVVGSELAVVVSAAVDVGATAGAELEVSGVSDEVVGSDGASPVIARARP